MVKIPRYLPCLSELGEYGEGYESGEDDEEDESGEDDEEVVSGEDNAKVTSTANQAAGHNIAIATTEVRIIIIRCRAVPSQGDPGERRGKRKTIFL